MAEIRAGSKHEASIATTILFEPQLSGPFASLKAHLDGCFQPSLCTASMCAMIVLPAGIL